MVKFNISITLDDSQIQGLYQLFLYKHDGFKRTKKEFVEYMKTQVACCGADEFFLSTDMSFHEELTMGDIEQLMKWGLI